MKHYLDRLAEEMERTPLALNAKYLSLVKTSKKPAKRVYKRRSIVSGVVDKPIPRQSVVGMVVDVPFRIHDMDMIKQVAKIEFLIPKGE